MLAFPKFKNCVGKNTNSLERIYNFLPYNIITSWNFSLVLMLQEYFPIIFIADKIINQEKPSNISL